MLRAGVCRVCRSIEEETHRPLVPEKEVTHTHRQTDPHPRLRQGSPLRGPGPCNQRNQTPNPCRPEGNRIMKMDIFLGVLLLLTTIPAVKNFNIDTKRSWSFADKKSLFGQKVIQHKDGDKHWIFVTSPAGDIQDRRFGGLYKCEVLLKEARCKCERLDLTRVTENPRRREHAWPGASLATSSDSVLACVQYKSSPFRSTTGELNGQCTLFTAGLQNQTFVNLSKIVEEGLTARNKNNNNKNRNRRHLRSPVGVLPFGGIVQGSSTHGNQNNNNNGGEEDEDSESRTEIAIVLDGSGSIDARDFEKAKDFISNMMKKFWKKCLECEFAVVQYGTQIRTEFDLRKSQDSRAALQKVQDIRQVGNVTRTASAMQHVLDSIFSEAHGSKRNAKKIIVVLTDGEIFMDEMNLTTVINSPKMANVERYVIGVGEAFNKKKALEELQLIASDPDEKHLFRVTNYSALDALLSGLQQKLVGMEGTKGDVLQFELAELGFSSQILDQQSLLFGAVGAFDWSGGLVRYSTEMEEDRVVFLNESQENAHSAKYSYLGYSLALVRGRQKEPLYISGAPRHSNTGKVLVFEKDIHSYRLIASLPGEQVGSYFGAELCPVDLDMDELTDYLLIGAPFYHIKGEEGRVDVYKFDKQDRFTLVKALSGRLEYTFARFGLAIASIGDINRDGYSDIAIGAPLEQDSADPSSSGSVYIYNGAKDGIMDTWSQWIRAAEVSKGLKYFGQSIDGGLDFTEDENVDITVGALGHMLVLRSRPVIRLRTSMRFTPDKVPIASVDNTIKAHLCFEIDSDFENLDTQKSRILYTLDLDVGMEPRRILFEDPKACTHTGSLLIPESTCMMHGLMVLPCKHDCFTSINISLRYSLKVDVMRDLAAPILDRYGTSQTYIELPYVKDCNNKPICVADLRLNTSFSEKELVVGVTKNLTMNISLENKADDSYLTTMSLTFPRNLQVKKILAPSSPSVKCAEPSPLTPRLSSVSCKIGHPVFRKSSAHVSIIWQLDEDMFPAKDAVFDVNITSINEAAQPVTRQDSIPVKHSFTAVLSRPRAVIEVNISQGVSKNKDVRYEFNLNGENRYGAQVELAICIPVKIQGITVTSIKMVHSTQNSTRCHITDEEIDPTERIRGLSLCDAPEYQAVRCAIVTHKEDITVHAELLLDALQQVVEDKTDLVVSAEIRYNEDLFADLKPGSHRDTITVVLLKDRNFLTLPLVIGSAAGGLLLLALIVVVMWRCGFFKRSYKDRREE